MPYKVERYPQPGDRVIYTDPVGREHEALVTAGWSAGCANLVYVSPDESKQDQYGRQLEVRPTSCTIWSEHSAHGNKWRWPDQTEACDYASLALVPRLKAY